MVIDVTVAICSAGQVKVTGWGPRRSPDSRRAVPFSSHPHSVRMDRRLDGWKGPRHSEPDVMDAAGACPGCIAE